MPDPCPVTTIPTPPTTPVVDPDDPDNTNTGNPTQLTTGDMTIALENGGAKITCARKPVPAHIDG